MNVADWLRVQGLEQHEAAFRENDVDVEVLPTLTADELKDIGVSSIRHRRRLLEAIAVLRSKSMGPEAPALTPLFPSSDTRGQPGASETTPERRPLSVMFCDLAGSTALSSQLDPEDLREIIRNYQGCVATTIQHFDGFIARYVGDGVLVYFGWPEARETDAERAVRAGLAVASAVSAERPGGQPLQVRIGIATGLVVIGEPIGSGDSRQQTAVGETPNLAARLQSLARPGQVVIDAATRRQIGGLFECQDLGTAELKGLSVAVPAWRVVSENRAVGQFEALRSGTTPLVGRDEEMELLLRRWGQAKAGSGRVVLISAEPGVGKSRLSEALAERIAAEPHIRLRYFCSPHHQDSALYPIIAQMERAAGFAHEDAPTAKIAKLQAVLAATTLPMEEVALIAELHSLPPVDLVPPLDLTPQRKKEKTFDALLRQVEGLSRQQPVLMMFDDIHWIDPSSRELMDRTVARVADWPVLLLAMFRPEFQPPWTGQPHVTMLTLPRLDRRDTAAMVANVAGNAVLSAEVMEEIAERTDGVPLFVEELTKAVLESGSLGGAALSAVPHPSVPATLHASLMARLDRLGSAAKEVAQAGAAIGREFGYDLLASVSDLPPLQLSEALDRLVNAGLLFARGIPPEASYLFKHALVQDAAYGSLLRGRRQSLHRRVAATLEERFPEVVTAQPALLAQHCQEAGLAEQAVVYWLQAGQQALARSAMSEAVAQMRKGLEVLTRLPDGRRRQQQELDLQVELRSALTATKGWAATEVEETLARGRVLAEQLGRPEHLVRLILGQWSLHHVRSEHRLALPLAEHLQQIGEMRNDAGQSLSRYAQGVTRLTLGEFVAARALPERYRDLAEPTDRVIGGLSFDPQTATSAYLALTLTCLGYIDQARSRMDEALSKARRLNHVHTLAHELCLRHYFDWLTCSPMLHTEELLALSAEHGFPYFLGWGLIFRGRSLITLGQAREGLALLIQGLAHVRATGAILYKPMLLTWLSEAHAILGRFLEAQKYLAETAQFVETTQERAYEAELLHRVPGDLLNAAGDQPAAEQHYRQAIVVAERQSARLFQLRASVSLARLWRDQGNRAKARYLLGPVYNWFTEGFDAPDLKEAKALLDELA
jgi:class 3 adenylate cyclase/tetratricopeptide (TPR) repeat protein